jgi:hypothetical protein
VIGGSRRPRTRSTVLFLGAGASRPFGFPTTAEILPEILDRLARDRLFCGTATSERTRALQESLRDFLPGLFDAEAEAPLITDVLSLLDHLLETGQPARPGQVVADLERLRVLLEEAMAEVLATPLQAKRAAQNASLLDRLALWMSGLAKSEGRRLSIITTNYDVAIEKRLYRELRAEQIPEQVDLGFAWRPTAAPGERAVHLRPARPRLAFYKLHGSLDWLRCPLCDHVYVDPARTIFRGRPAADDTPTPSAEQGVQACVCGHAPLRHILVAPSMVRDVRNPNLLSIWQSAFEALRTADEWTIIGYSLPPEDLAIRSMLLRAFRGRAEPPRVTLVERGDSRDVENRYRLLFPGLRVQTEGVEGFVEGLRPRSARAGRPAGGPGRRRGPAPTRHPR